jgi:hypothetical protein
MTNEKRNVTTDLLVFVHRHELQATRMKTRETNKRANASPNERESERVNAPDSDSTMNVCKLI